MVRSCESSQGKPCGRAKGKRPNLAVLLVTAACLVAALASPIYARAESTISCPWGMYDMLDWMTMDSDLRSTYHFEGTSNPVYTVLEPGKFYWVKGGLGYPWDIQRYDNNFIYLWITELSFSVPVSYKKFTNSTNLPLVPRCAIAGMPGSTLKSTNTNYDLHTNCSNTCSVTLGLQNSINQVWGPFTYSFGGDLPNNLKTLVIRYRYNCNGSFTVCGDREEYYVTQRYGLVQWIHYVWIPSLSSYEQLQKVVYNKLMVGVVTPNFPCF